MMKKLGVNNVAGLTQLALSAGLTRFPAAASPLADSKVDNYDKHEDALARYRRQRRTRSFPVRRIF